MNQQVIDELASRCLLGLADETERAALSAILAESPDARERFTEHASLHAALIREAKAGALTNSQSSFFSSTGNEPAKPSRTRRFWLPAAAAAVFIAMATVITMAWPGNASAALDQMILALDQETDRAYRIEVLDEVPQQPPPERDDRGRYPAGAFLDGASLWLRGSDHFVLQQNLPNGETRMMGGDGTSSWSIRGKGPVRISDDASRFGGGVIAKRREIAFLDLRNQVGELGRLYQLSGPERSADGKTSVLHGVRKSSASGGAREVGIWFDPATGLIHRITLKGLPRDQGGPESITIALVSAEPLAADFFSHQSHHEPERPVVRESPAGP